MVFAPCASFALWGQYTPAKSLRNIKKTLAQNIFPWQCLGMKTASDIIEAVGREKLKAVFGVANRVLQVYAQSNRLPASWFDGMEQMTGAALPRDLFTFKPVPKQRKRRAAP